MRGSKEGECASRVGREGERPPQIAFARQQPRVGSSCFQLLPTCRATAIEDLDLHLSLGDVHQDQSQHGGEQGDASESLEGLLIGVAEADQCRAEAAQSES